MLSSVLFIHESRKRGMEGEREVRKVREGGREGGRERGREEGRKGGREEVEGRK